MSKTKALSIFFCVIYFLSNYAWAGTSSGSVTSVTVNAYNYLFFSNGTKSGTPGCGSGNPNDWAVDLSTAKGRSIYALVLSSQIQGKSITVIGGNQCTTWGDREDVLYMFMTP